MNEDVRREEKVYRALLAGCDPRIQYAPFAISLCMLELMAATARRLFAEVLSSGTHRGFHCIVFELCGATLYDMVKGQMGLLPFPARHTLEIAYQLINAVGCMYQVCAQCFCV